jgi:hypothetical protein
MTREEISALMFRARTRVECETAKAALLAYLKEHPDDLDLQEEGGSLYMKQVALESMTAPEREATTGRK